MLNAYVCDKGSESSPETYLTSVSSGAGFCRQRRSRQGPSVAHQDPGAAEVTGKQDAFQLLGIGHWRSKVRGAADKDAARI
jgi:hypothetical protein